MRIVPDFFFDEGVAAIVRTFKKHAPGQMRFVGGCVRDALLRRTCNDVDVATPLTPDEVTRIFQSEGFHVEPTGIEHGTVTVIWNHQPFEITTLRRDVETDGRRAVVAFTSDWAEDAERRDFTVNALYLDYEGNVYDPWGDDFGFENLTDRKLVFVGNAETRIREDALRIIRLYRFMSTLEFKADWTAREACKKLSHLIDNLSGERLEKEIVKLVSGPNAVGALQAMAEDGVFERIFYFTPDMKAIKERFERKAKFEVKAPPLNLIWMWDVDVAEKVCQRWKTSHAMRVHTVDLVAPGPIDLASASRQSIWEIAHRTTMFATSYRIRTSWIENPCISHEEMEELVDAVGKTPEFPIRGQDLIDAGMKPGREIGQRLKTIEEWWIREGFPEEAIVREKLREEVQ